MLTRLYIGSNNSSKVLELDKIKQLLSEHFEGFTIETATGYWKGEEKQTAIVSIETDKDLPPIIRYMREQLNQESIAFEAANSTLIFV